MEECSYVEFSLSIRINFVVKAITHWKVLSDCYFRDQGGRKSWRNKMYSFFSLLFHFLCPLDFAFDLRINGSSFYLRIFSVDLEDCMGNWKINGVTTFKWSKQGNVWCIFGRKLQLKTLGWYEKNFGNVFKIFRDHKIDDQISKRIWVNVQINGSEEKCTDFRKKKT